jgi:tRNA pseudouridine55 synthase
VPSIETISKQIPHFTGSIKQRPPIYSSVHINGKRAYKRALDGEDVLIPERDVTVFSIEIIKWDNPVLLCRIHCSRGTYIRSLADNLGKACGSCAYLQSLKRLSVGPFIVDDAVAPEHFNPAKDITGGRAVFNLLDAYRPEDFKIIEIDKFNIEHIRNGKKLYDKIFIEPPEANGKYAVFYAEEFIAYIEKDGEHYKYVFVNEIRDCDENN